MLDKVRAKLHEVIATSHEAGEGPGGPAVIEVPKLFARRLNRFFGDPICSEAEIAKRRAARAKLAGFGAAKEVRIAREPAPVIVYFEKDRNQRLIERTEELLKSRGIAYRALDVTGDEATLAFIMREAKCEEDDLPIVYVAGTPVGGYNEVVEWDVAGKLKTAVWG
jgi:glutaredoxin